MAYENYFGLIEKPFEYLIPDPRFYYFSPQALALKKQCSYILSEKNGHIFISGEYGSGKTSFLKTITRNLIADKKNIVNFINAPDKPTRYALIRRVAEGFEVKTERSYDKTLENLTEWLKKTKRFPVLIIDEGQGLPLDSLKTLHYLQTYVTDRLLMMILLCGQPEMVTKIEKFKALRSRMIPASLSSFTKDEAEEMMRFRWQVASGNKKNPFPFTRGAIAEIFRHAKGNPRSVCQASDITLLAAFNMKKKKVDDKITKMVTRSLLTEAEKHE